MDEFGGYPHDSGNPPRLVHVRPSKTTKLSGSPTQAISAEERRRRDTWSPGGHAPGMPRIGAVRGQGVWSQHRPLDILGCFSQTHLSLGVSCVSKKRVTISVTLQFARTYDPSGSPVENPHLQLHWSPPKLWSVELQYHADNLLAFGVSQTSRPNSWGSKLDKG